VRVRKYLANGLANKIDTDRVLRTLASYYLVKEVDVDSFAATPFTDSMTDQTWKDALGLMQVQCIGITFVMLTTVKGAVRFERQSENARVL